MGIWNITKTTLLLTSVATVAAAKITGKVAKKVGKVAYDNRGKVIDVAVVVKDATITTVSVGAYGVYKTGEYAYNHRNEIIGSLAGAGKGSVETLKNINGFFKDNEKLLDTLKKQSNKFKKHTKATAAKINASKGALNERDVLLDTLVVGGTTFSAYSLGEVPENIEEAYKLAYPVLSESKSFTEAIADMGPDELRGLASGVKGKLFEIDYVDYLNDGQLPQGFEASLAESATQEGWDIQVTGPDGVIANQIQAKATDSVSYVQEALEKYPNIDVVTTSEVHSQLVMQGYADNIIDSGISEDFISTSVGVAFEGAYDQFDFTPPIIGLALIAFSSYSKEELDAYSKSKNFGERAAKSYFAHVAGGAIALATGTWWIGLIGGMGTRLIVGKGRAKRQQEEQLKALIKTNQLVLSQLPSIK